MASEGEEAVGEKPEYLEKPQSDHLLRSINHPSESEGEGDVSEIVVSKERQAKLKRDRIVFFALLNLILIVLGTMYSFPIWLPDFHETFQVGNIFIFFLFFPAIKKLTPPSRLAKSLSIR